MKGIMNAKYTGNERDAKNTILNLIQKVMSTEVVYVKGVSQVQYIGDRDSYNYLNTLKSGANSSRHMQSFGMALGIAVTVAVVIGLAAGMLVAIALKKRRGNQDSQTGSRMSVTSIEVVEIQEQKTEEEKSNVEIVSSIQEGDSTVASENKENSIMPTPPKSQSLSSKRRRRRKKKKKKKVRMGLTRSNSVNSMDTITEEQEEENHDDDWSDWGSEYSTDEENQDCHMKRTMSTGTLSSDPSVATLSFHLEQVMETPRIRKLPPPPV